MEANRRSFLLAGATLAAAPSVLAQTAPAPAAAQTPDLPTVTAPGYAAPSETRKIEIRNLASLEEPARKIIPAGGFGYISSGAGDE